MFNSFLFCTMHFAKHETCFDSEFLTKLYNTFSIFVISFCNMTHLKSHDQNCFLYKHIRDGGMLQWCCQITFFLCPHRGERDTRDDSEGDHCDWPQDNLYSGILSCLQLNLHDGEVGSLMKHTANLSTGMHIYGRQRKAQSMLLHICILLAGRG